MSEELVFVEARRGLFHVPDDLALRMISECSQRIAVATTIPHVKRVITEAEAIQAVTKKFELSRRIQERALELRVQAERQLGEITKRMPQAPRGGGAKPGLITTKTERLLEQGISKARASRAEKLADVPKAAVDAAIEEVRPPTLTGVVQKLGLVQPWPHKQSATDRVRELVSLLERLLREDRAPTERELARARELLPRGKGNPKRKAA